MQIQKTIVRHIMKLIAEGKTLEDISRTSGVPKITLEQWTAETREKQEAATIEKYLLAGKPKKWVAEKMQLSEKELCSKLKRYSWINERVALKKKRDALKRQITIKAQIKAGKTKKQIAKKRGVTVPTICNWLKPIIIDEPTKDTANEQSK